MWVRVMPRERLSFASRRPYEPYRTFHTYLHHYADKNLEAISAMLAKSFERIHRSNLVDIGYFVNKKETRHVASLFLFLNISSNQSGCNEP